MGKWVDYWEGDIFHGPEISPPEPHCRVCAAQMAEEENELLFMRPPHPDQIKDGMVTFKISRPLMSQFGVDESYAREANEFGY